MSSARDITRAAWPPRSAYLDYPLGRTAGRPHEPGLNLQILRDALAAFENLRVPGSMTHLRYRWSDDDRWKDSVFAPVAGAETLAECAVPAARASETAAMADNGKQHAAPVYEDDRIERHLTPQYQTDEDAAASRAGHDGQDCLVCAGIDY
ncbi:hypothetical protein [Candidatus Poriferisodalis sp.]|uniref:hypothetical protein n=1 Tax=Candidatus Poriferisodalis sp. TaxID=3101277 RepID=UPI003B014061